MKLQASCQQLTVKCVQLENSVTEYLYLDWRTKWQDWQRSIYKAALIDPSILHFVELLKAEMQKQQFCETYVVSIAQILTIHTIRSVESSEGAFANCLIKIHFN